MHRLQQHRQEKALEHLQLQVIADVQNVAEEVTGQQPVQSRHRVEQLLLTQVCYHMVHR